MGTTSTRALESAALGGLFEGEVREPLELVEDGSYRTNLFIQPGFRFDVVDRLITNFHQPSSTHLLLVNTFAGTEDIKKRYQYALEKKLRFLSYGDSMLLERAVSPE